MTSRKERQQSANRGKLMKLLVGAFLIFIIIGSSLNIAFADQDIQSLLSNWFEQKKTESIEEIDEAIAKEQEEQTKRLKEELQIEIEILEKQLDEFIAQEKEKRILALQEYADEIITSFDIDQSEEEENLIAEFEQIVLEAKDKMDNVRPKLNNPENVAHSNQSETE